MATTFTPRAAALGAELPGFVGEDGSPMRMLGL
jgi:hypothetical protein